MGSNVNFTQLQSLTSKHKVSLYAVLFTTSVKLTPVQNSINIILNNAGLMCLIHKLDMLLNIYIYIFLSWWGKSSSWKNFLLLIPNTSAIFWRNMKLWIGNSIWDHIILPVIIIPRELFRIQRGLKLFNSKFNL